MNPSVFSPQFLSHLLYLSDKYGKADTALQLDLPLPIMDILVDVAVMLGLRAMPVLPVQPDFDVIAFGDGFTGRNLVARESPTCLCFKPHLGSPNAN